MKVSFIIVAYNAEKALDTSLRSLSGQDYPHDKIEVILVDGMSTDNTKQVMLNYQVSETTFNRIVVKDNPGKYLACGWNVALNEAKGDVILRVDAHTRFDKNFISNNIKVMKGGKSICGGKVVSLIENETPWNRLLLEAENSMFGGGFTFFRRGETEKYTDTLAFAMYRKEVFDVVGRYDERLVRTEDNEMHYRMRKAGYKFFFSPLIVSYRYSRSTIKSLLKQKYLNGFWVGLTMRVAPKAFSIAYFIPFGFVLAIIAGILIIPIHYIPIVTLFILYGIVLLLSLFISFLKGFRQTNVLLLPFLLMGLHVSYGVGTLVGLLKMPFWLKKNK